MAMRMVDDELTPRQAAHATPPSVTRPHRDDEQDQATSVVTVATASATEEEDRRGQERVNSRTALMKHRYGSSSSSSTASPCEPATSLSGAKSKSKLFSKAKSRDSKSKMSPPDGHNTSSSSSSSCGSGMAATAATPAPAAAAAASATRTTSGNLRRSSTTEEEAPSASSVAPGDFRYLKPKEIECGKLPVYEFALIVNRSVHLAQTAASASTTTSAAASCWDACCCCVSSSSRYMDFCNNESAHERAGFRRLCGFGHHTMGYCESEDEHRRIVDKLCQQGLLVDIIDGGHSNGDELNAEFFILLIKAPEQVIQSYLQHFRYRLWMMHGAVADMEQDLVHSRNDVPTPAERIQIVDYIIEHRAQLSMQDPWIHDMFPLHDSRMTDSLISKWVTSCNVLELNDKKFIKAIRYNYGEKVAYYFAFLNYYNKFLIPLAVLGIAVQIARHFMPTEMYMRLLPFWGIGVCVIWSFGFLKCWERKNAAMQFEWNDKLHVKQVEYPNKNFRGKQQINALTGEVTLVYPSWRRWPKIFCMMLFMLLQTAIMLVLVAVWVTIYEMLKAHYPNGGLFTVQWFLILLEGIVFGIFVDVIQWQLVVTKMARFFTHWENYRTEEAFEKALIRKLFVLDFLNYYTWFFSLAFVFVIPGIGDYLTNSLNHFFFGDAMNCCFGPYVDQHGTCTICPLGPKDATCIECVGVFSFDRHHVDLSAMFVTPIVVTQTLNIALGLILPVFSRLRHERAHAEADARAQQRVKETGSMKILGSLDYDKQTQFGNKSHARYLEYTAPEIEVLNKKAREILFESEKDAYDPYDDFHALTVQYGFTVMFSVLWPPMPFACFLINSLKRRADGFRLCKTLKRPIPRKANGIGGWRGILSAFAYTAVIVNVLLVCISTGSLEFFDPLCVRDIQHQLEKQGKTLNDFVMGPDFGCLHISWRLLIILVLEHIFVGLAYLMMTRIPRVPYWIEEVMNSREAKFKQLLKRHEAQLFDGDSSNAGFDSKQAQAASGARHVELTLQPPSSLAPDLRRTLSVDSGEESSSAVLEEPKSTGFRTRSREQLARKWSTDETM